VTSRRSSDRDVIPESSGIQFIEIGGARLEYLDIPARNPGRPELLFLHEGLGCVSLWRDFPARVASATGCRAVVYSRRGYGRSSPRKDPYTPRFVHDEALETLPQLRAGLGIARPVLVGHSTGASMALVHAASGDWPVAGVVAMAPLTFVEESNLESIRNAASLYATTGLREKLARHHDDVDAVFRGWNDIWLDPRFRSWNVARDLAGIRCALLAILGANDEYSTPAQVDLIEKNAARAASFERLELADCGHAPHRDQPRAVLEAVTRFVDAV
jgi:pimeloyl-ACP methyl ester carboxylesterase